nr:glutamine synthetase [Caldilineaceae bacterium]
MTAIRGMLTPDDLAGKVQSGVIDTVLAVFTDHYGRFMGKRFDAEFFVEDILRQGTHACDYLLTVDMEMEPVPGYAFANWERGYGDFHLLPDISTLRLASWLDRTALVVCDVENERAHKLVEQTPRTILRKQIERAAALGYTAMAATELEYYIYTDSYREAHRKGYAGLSAAGWYIEDYHALQGSREEFFNAEVRRHLKASGIPVENSKGEWGLGQHELNVRYADALTMADRHVIYKQCLKEVADSLGISVTFMAKIDEKQAGSSSHIHLSLWKDGQAAFAGDQPICPVLG